MLLQTNSYIVPKDKRSEHARLLRKFRATLQRLGCDHFEVYEQVGANWAGGEATGRFVQIMRFRDRQHQQQIQQGEKTDPDAQRLIQDFCALINFPYQQQQGLFAVGFYTSAIPVAPPPPSRAPRSAPSQPPAEAAGPEAHGEQSGDTAASAAGAAGTALAIVPDDSDASQPAEAAAAEGSSLLDFANMSPEPAAAEDERPPMRLTSDAEDAIVAEDVPSESPNGEHPALFSDAPEAMLDLVNSDDETHNLLTDEDREAVLGELTGEDASPHAAADDDDAQARSHHAR
jgi:hypothetical protein